MHIRAVTSLFNSIFFILFFTKMLNADHPSFALLGKTMAEMRIYGTCASLNSAGV